MARLGCEAGAIWIKALVVILLVCLCFYGLQGIYGFSLFPDEFGYWASAASLLGFDFSNVSSIGSFYSFGYSLVLSPVLLIFEDSIAAYRAAVIINLVFQCLSFFILIRISDKLFEDADKIFKALLAGACVLYPSWVFYTQMTMSESLLFFMYTVVVYVMLCYLERPSLIRGVLLAFAAVYIYSVHMRTVGIVATVFIVVVADAFFRFKKSGGNGEPSGRHGFITLSTVVLLAAGFIVCLIIKDHVIDVLYTSGQMDRTYVNDYSGQVSKLGSLFSLKGMDDFLKSLCGKILYLGCASFGTAYIGIYYLTKRAFKKDLKALSILIASFMQFMVMCIYLSGSSGWDRFDLFLHGRYFDFCIPILMMTGIYDLFQNGDHYRKIIISALIIAASALFSCLLVIANSTGFSDPHGMLMIGMSYFLDDEDVKPLETIIFNVMISLLIMCIILLIVSIYIKQANVYLLCFIHLLLIVLSYHACNHFIYACQTYIYGDIQVADEISDLRIAGYEGDIVLLYEGGLEYIDTVQLRLRYEHINVVYVDNLDALSSLKEDDLVLVDYRSALNEQLPGTYNSSWESGHFELYYNDVGGTDL